MIVYLQLARIIEATSSKVFGTHEWHVTRAAIVLGDRRIVKRLAEKAGDTAKEIRVVVILAAHPLVVIELFWQVDLVTCRTEFGATMKVLQKTLLVECWLAFHELTVDPLQKGTVAERERVMQRLLEREGRVSTSRVDIGYCVTGRASDPCARHRILAEVVARVVESSALERSRKERHRIMAACAPARRVNISVALHAH